MITNEGGYFYDQDMMLYDRMIAPCSHASESSGLEEDILSKFADKPDLDNTPLCVTYRSHHTLTQHMWRDCNVTRDKLIQSSNHENFSFILFLN